MSKKKCPTCHGHGEVYKKTGNISGADPDLWATKPCPDCNGTGYIETAPTPPDQPEDAALREKVQIQVDAYTMLKGGDPSSKTLGAYIAIDNIMQLFHAHEQEKVHAARVETGLVDIDGVPIKLGDTLRKLYITPMGELTNESDDDYFSKGEVSFEKGAYCLRVAASPDPIPLFKLLKTKEGEYVSNYGNKTIYSNVVIARVQPPAADTTKQGEGE